MYIDIVPNRNSPPAILLREARRQGKKIVKVTLANLSHLPPHRIEMLRRVLKGEPEELAGAKTLAPWSKAPPSGPCLRLRPFVSVSALPRPYSVCHKFLLLGGSQIPLNPSSVRLGFCISVIFLRPKLWREMVANPGVLLHINT